MDLVLEKKGIYTEHKSIFGLPNLYYEPVEIDFFGTIVLAEPTMEEMITAYYMARENEVFGYYTDLKSINSLKGTTQVPAKIKIVSNRVKEVTVHMNEYTMYTVYPTNKKITSDNYLYLEILDDIEYYSKYFEEDIIKCIRKIITKNNMKHEEFDNYISKYKYSDMTKEVIINAFAK